MFGVQFIFPLKAGTLIVGQSLRESKFYDMMILINVWMACPYPCEEILFFICCLKLNNDLCFLTI